MNSLIPPEQLETALKADTQFSWTGEVLSVRGPVVTAKVPRAGIGDLCYIHIPDSKKVPARVVAFDGNQISLVPIDSTQGIVPGAPVSGSGIQMQVPVSEDFIGRVIDATGNPIDGLGEIAVSKEIPVHQESPSPLDRIPINQQLQTGIRGIDGICGIARGQRIGLFAGPGAGKSTLLGMMAKNADVDLTVVALVGERGREVHEFVEETLGKEGLKKSIVVVSTSDETPIRRFLAAQTATAIAEWFRDKGKRVLLLVDSLTRMARAVRDMSLAAGEVPVRQGYTASVYSELPALLERAGNNARGSITAVYTVLTARDEENDPLGEEIKSILDGHIVLDEEIAARGVRPAIDFTRSISRLSGKIYSEKYEEIARSITEILTRLKNDRDIVLLGGDPDPALEAALKVEPELLDILKQRPGDFYSLQETKRVFAEIQSTFKGL